MSLHAANMFTLVVDYMNSADATELEPIAKKTYVKQNLKEVLGEEKYARYEQIFDEMIDGLVSIKKGRIHLLRRYDQFFGLMKHVRSFCKRCRRR